jgi:hypothetical protein
MITPYGNPDDNTTETSPYNKPDAEPNDNPPMKKCFFAFSRPVGICVVGKGCYWVEP